MKGKRCPAYCGITCVNGQCPNALDDMDRRSDTDAYASYHLEKKLSCNDCPYYLGCEDCYFDGTKECVKEKGDQQMIEYEKLKKAEEELIEKKQVYKQMCFDYLNSRLEKRGMLGKTVKYKKTGKGSLSELNREHSNLFATSVIRSKRTEKFL